MEHKVSIKDCEVSFFNCPGPGGQHKNKHANCVRLFHKPSGARTTGQNHKELHRNKIDAMKGLAKDPKFRFWAAQELLRLEGGETIEQAVERQMREVEVTDLKGNPI